MKRKKRNGVGKDFNLEKVKITFSKGAAFLKKMEASLAIFGHLYRQSVKKDSLNFIFQKHILPKSSQKLKNKIPTKCFKIN